MNYKRLYVSNSLIFITIVTKDRKPLLIDNINYLREAFKISKQKYLFDIIAIIINKDHFHMIIKPYDISSYPKIIGCIKSTFTKSRVWNIKITKKENQIYGKEDIGNIQ